MARARLLRSRIFTFQYSDFRLTLARATAPNTQQGQGRGAPPRVRSRLPCGAAPQRHMFQGSGPGLPASSSVSLSSAVLLFLLSLSRLFFVSSLILLLFFSSSPSLFWWRSRLVRHGQAPGSARGHPRCDSSARQVCEVARARVVGTGSSCVCLQSTRRTPVYRRAPHCD